MRWPFRRGHDRPATGERSPGRRAQGRHSFGAAVTSIPSALPTPLRPPPAPPPPVLSPVLPPVSPALPVDAGPPRPLAERSTPVEAVLPPSPLLPIAVVPPLPAPRPAVVQPVQPLDLPAAPPAEVPAAAGPRVELGFTDGSFRTLDPASSQAAALSELAEQLTRRR